MSKHTQPREIAELSGATARNPQRYRNDVIKSDMPLGEPPERMSAEAKAAWFEISALAIPGILTGPDRFLFEMLCNDFAEYIADPKGCTPTNKKTIHGLFGRFGMSPSDRNKLGFDRKPDTSDFETL